MSSKHYYNIVTVHTNTHTHTLVTGMKIAQKNDARNSKCSSLSLSMPCIRHQLVHKSTEKDGTVKPVQHSKHPIHFLLKMLASVHTQEYTIAFRFTQIIGCKMNNEIYYIF